MRADAARNHAAIIDATRELITASGVEFTMEQVASAAGVGMGTVYRRFPDRAALLHTVVTELIEDVSGRLDAAESGLGAGAGPIERWNVLYAAIAQSPLPRLLPHLFEVNANREVFDAEAQAARGKVLQRLGAALKAAQDAGGVRTDISLLDVAFLTAAALRPMPALPQDLTAAMMPRLRALLAASFAPSPNTLPGKPIQPEEALEAL